MRVAVIGCGGIGRLHAGAYKALGHEIVYMMDTMHEAAQTAAEQFGARAVTNLEEMTLPLDTVSVVTPPMAHYAPIIWCLERGIPVFSEKPLTMDLDQADEIVRVSETRGVPVGMGFKMRYEPVFRRARELIGRLGELYAVSVVKCQPYTPRPGGWVPQVGCMYELSVHEYDLIQWIAGIEAESVSATSMNTMGWSREDRAYLDVVYTGGVRGQLMSHYLPDTTFSFCDLAITYIGQCGYLRIERPGRLFLHTDGDEVFTVEPEQNATLFALQLGDFLASLGGGAAKVPGAREGRQITALVEAARLATKTGERVRI